MPRTLETVLTMHMMPLRTTPAGRLLAGDYFTDATGKPGIRWVDVTGWTMERLLGWLGHDGYPVVEV